MNRKMILLSVLVVIGLGQESPQMKKSVALDTGLDLPEIPSPYLFQNKQMNLKAIGDNLNPSLAELPINVSMNKQAVEKIQPPVQQTTYKVKTQLNSQLQMEKYNQTDNTDKLQPNNNLHKNQSSNITKDGNIQKSTKNEAGQPSSIEKQQKQVQRSQFQKIDLKKLRQQIEKEEKNSQTFKSNQSKTVYQTIFGPLKLEETNISATPMHQQHTQNDLQMQNSTKSENRGEFKDLSNDKQQSQFKQQDKKQLEFTSYIPKANEKQKQADQQVGKTEKSSLQQNLKEELQKSTTTKVQSSSIDIQNYKQKYDKLLKQMNELKQTYQAEKQQRNKTENPTQENKQNNKSQVTFCLSLKAAIILTVVVSLAALFMFSQKAKAARIKDRYSLGQNNKIPSQEID